MPHTAIVVDLPLEVANCTASSTANSSTVCDNAMDLQKTISLGTEWISANEDAGGWITIQWTNHWDVIAVEIWARLGCIRGLHKGWGLGGGGGVSEGYVTFKFSLHPVRPCILSKLHM